LNSIELKSIQVVVTILSVPFCPYHVAQCHFIGTILSATILSGHRMRVYNTCADLTTCMYVGIMCMYVCMCAWCVSA